MTPSPEHDDEKLEQFVQRAVCDLPPRRAPRTLEARVRAAIERRAALPWWRLSFAHWPVAARAVFVVLSVGLAGFVVVGGMWLSAGLGGPLPAALASPVGWFDDARIVLRAIGGVLAIVERHVPPFWLHGALVLFAGLYFTLFGLGAAAYKLLHAPSPH